MELNTDVAAILEQAACRRVDVKRARFRPNPDTADHSGRVIEYEVHFDDRSKKDPATGRWTVKDEELKKKPSTVLNHLLGAERQNTKEGEGRKHFLDTPIEKLLEM